MLVDKKWKMVVSGVLGLKVWLYRGVLFVVNLRVEGNVVRKFLEVVNFFKVGMVVVVGDGLFIFLDCVDVFLNLKMVGKMKFDFKVFLFLYVYFFFYEFFYFVV